MPKMLTRLFGAVVALLVVGSLATAAFYFYQYRRTVSEQPEQELQELVETLSEVIELPNEEPTLATVTDPTKLAAQPFFRTAMAGDKVLIYTEARKAILFRPATGKIIDVTTIQTVPPAVPALPSPASTPETTEETPSP